MIGESFDSFLNLNAKYPATTRQVTINSQELNIENPSIDVFIL